MKLGLSNTDVASLEIALSPNYDYTFEGKLDKEDVRAHGGMFSKKIASHILFTIPEEWVTTSQRSIVNSWWSTGTNLKFIENHTKANSTHIVRIIGSEEPYQNFRLPYYDTLRTGELTLETIGAIVVGAHNDLDSIQGGSSSQRYHFTQTIHDSLQTTGAPQFARLGLGLAADATDILSLLQTSTTNNSAVVDISHTGIISGTGYGIKSSVTGASTTNIAGYYSATGATNNYGLIIENGNVGVNVTSPDEQFVCKGSIKSLGSNSDNHWTVFISNTAGNTWRAVSPETDKEELFIDCLYTAGGSPAGNTNMLFRTGDSASPSTKMWLLESGSLGIGASPTAVLDISSDVLRLRTSKTPASAGAAGNQGDIAWDSSYFYICISTNTWQRVAHATW
jgi:hypothetical protein